jgi:hypothetical protein
MAGFSNNGRLAVGDSPALERGVPEHVSVGGWLETWKRTPQVASFVAAGPGLAELPLTDLTVWLPVVRRFAWPVVSS